VSALHVEDALLATPTGAAGRMSLPRVHRPTRQAAVALAAVAGFVDAHLYLHLTPVFVANMSGNLIRLGMYATKPQWPEAIRAGVAVVTFVAGVVLATRHHERQRRAGRAPRPDALLVIEAALIVLVSILIAVGHLRFDAGVRIADMPVLAIAAFAMGIQASAMRRVGEVAVATTFETGTIVRIGERLVFRARREGLYERLQRSGALSVLVAVVVAYVVGALVAGLAGASPWWLLAPSAVLVATAVVLRGPGEPGG
jgi:uncharacterized membrane protein YoaK (UPF0700 family)